MTIISTIITRNYTVHSSDSLITKTNDKGDREPTAWQRSKIIKVDAFRGAMTYWGLAWYKIPDYEVFMHDWLNEKANLSRQYKSPEVFAKKVADDLNREFSKIKFAKPTDKGLGIHFTAYENIYNYWIPELFLISNWETPEYNSIRPSGWGVTRETYYAVPERGPDDRVDAPEFRLKVHSYLREGGFLFYNNGDPVIFNPIVNGILEAVHQLSLRKISKGIDDANNLITLAQTPIQVVSAIQGRFCKEGTRLVGGKLHNLAICSNSGEYYSTSGDNH